MEDACKIYIDRLTEDGIESVSFTLPPSLFGVMEDELTFTSPVEVDMQAYIASEHLVIRLNLSTSCNLPCLSCNEIFSYPLKLDNLYLSIPLEEIDGHIFDVSNEIRESLLLEVPRYAECSSGNCPKRVASQIKKSTPEKKNVYFPFANLDS